MVIRTRTQTRFAVLPPSRFAVPTIFRNIEAGTRRYRDLLAKMQRMRGRVYAGDHAIDKADLTTDGRHKLSVDEDSWHVLSLDQHGEVAACLRYVDESNARGFDDLWVRHAAVARCPRLGWKFREAVELSLQRTRQAAIRFGEVGGWAVSEEHRGTAEPLRIILATYGLLELLGSCAGVATATFRHSSARILQKNRVDRADRGWRRTAALPGRTVRLSDAGAAVRLTGTEFAVSELDRRIEPRSGGSAGDLSSQHCHHPGPGLARVRLAHAGAGPGIEATV